MYYQYGQNRIFGAKFDPEIYKRGILFIGSPGIISIVYLTLNQTRLCKTKSNPNVI